MRYGAVQVARQRDSTVWAFAFTPLAPVTVLAAATAIQAVLEQRHEVLFGHAVIVSTDGNLEPGGAPSPALVDALRAAINRGEAVAAGGVYCDYHAAELLATAGTWRRWRDLWRLERVATASLAELPARRGDWFWCRQGDLQRILETVHERLNTGVGTGATVVAGSDRSSVQRYVERAALQLLGPAGAQPVPRLGVVRGRRSASHPFLNCLTDAPLDSVPEFLVGPEAATWAEVAPVLSTLTQRGGEHYPDRAFQELVIGTGLYLLANARRNAARSLPAPILVLDIDRYDPVARRAVLRMLRDLLQLPATVVFVTVGSDQSPELQAIAPRRVTIRPLSRSAIAALLNTEFPGVTMPDRALDQLLRLSAGSLRSVQLCLRSLVFVGKFASAADRWRWVPHHQLVAALPATPDGAAWRIARDLAAPLQEALLAVQLCGGLLLTAQLARFLVMVGHPVDEVSATFETLAVIGLVDLWPQLVPAFPRLTASLMRLLGPRGEAISERLQDLVVHLWRSGALSNHVLLFVYLSRWPKSAAVAAEVLYAAAQRRIEEAADDTAMALLKPAHLDRVRGQLGPEDAAALDYFVAVVTTRAGALQARARGTNGAVAPPTAASAPNDELAAFALTVGVRLHLQFGETDAALAVAKEALSRQQRPLRRGPEDVLAEEAYVDLAAAMLAAGNISEALGYLRYARQGDQRRARPYLVRVAALGAVAAFLGVRLDDATALATGGRQLAASTARRDWETFFGFLLGRVRVASGDYPGALVAFESALTVCEVYGLRRAATVIRHWHARAHALNGAARLAVELLLQSAAGRDPQVPEPPALAAERALFQAEAEYLAGDVVAAARALEATLAPALGAARGGARGPHFPAAAPTWDSGFLAVEGWCHRLGEDVTERQVRTFGAFLAAELRTHGSADEVREWRSTHAEEWLPKSAWESVEQLGHERHIRLDPSLIAYHAWYARISASAGPDQQDNHALVIVRGVAHLRERAAHILSPGDRKSYLETEHWNATLAGEARRMRLL